MASAHSVVPLIDADHHDDGYQLTSDGSRLTRADSSTAGYLSTSHRLGKGAIAGIAIAAVVAAVIFTATLYWLLRHRLARRSATSQWVRRHTGKWKQIGSEYCHFSVIRYAETILQPENTSSSTHNHGGHSVPPVFSKFASYKPAPILPVFAKFARGASDEDLSSPRSNSSTGMTSVYTTPTTLFTSVFAPTDWGSRCASDAATVRIPDPPMTPITRPSSLERGSGSGLHLIPENFVSRVLIVL